MSCSYISSNQIKDIEIMTKSSNVKLFGESFYVDLKSGEIDLDTHTLSNSLKERLFNWTKKFISFI